MKIYFYIIDRISINIMDTRENQQDDIDTFRSSLLMDAEDRSEFFDA